MTELIHRLVEQYGLFAVFIGCVAEGESAAILGGFFAHQAMFVPWQAFAAAASGAFVGDCAFFLLGRRFSAHPYVGAFRTRPGFAHADAILTAHPHLFVLFNRFVYGLRLVGGIAAGLSPIPLHHFLVLNALSSLIWASLFCGIGYVFGLGAEQLIGDALLNHERLLVALLIAVVATAAGVIAARHFGRQKRND